MRRVVKIRVGLMLVLAALAAACAPVPKMTPNVVGLGDLVARPPRVEDGRMPTATQLPGLIGTGAPGTATPRPEYLIGPLDQIVVTIWGRKDLGSQIPVALNGELKASTVMEDGTLVLPFLEPFSVRGMTVIEVQREVQSRYAKLFENPQVDVKLLECASRGVQITGEVVKPGRYYLCNDRLTIGELLAAAGSVTAFTDLPRGVLTRTGKPYRVDYSPELAGQYGGILLQDGDTIYFPRSDERVVLVLGELIKPGSYPIPRHGMTLAEALARATGPDNPTYQVSGIYLIRNQPAGPVVYRLKMAEIMQGPAIPLADGDRVFVATGGLARWDRFWRAILPFGTPIRTTYAF